jgi:hypothetical protein
MPTIDTEEAARRLARVILSDIELYSRERPKAGETLASQIEEGRKLFGSRVAPALLPIFAAVLADRENARATAPVAPQAPAAARALASDAEAPRARVDADRGAGAALVAGAAEGAEATGASGAPPESGQPALELPSPGSPVSTFDDQATPIPAPDPRAFEDQPTPRAEAIEQKAVEPSTPVPVIAPASALDTTARVAVTTARDFSDQPTPGPVVSAAIVADQVTPRPRRNTASRDLGGRARLVTPMAAAGSMPVRPPGPVAAATLAAPPLASPHPLAPGLPATPISVPAASSRAMVAKVPAAPVLVDEMPVPVLTSRTSMRKLLALGVVAALAVLLASVLYRFLQ